MNKNELPAAHAFIALTESTRVLANQPNARRFALTWIAAARMAVMGLLPDLKNLSDLNTLAGWQLVEAAGLPIDAVYGLFSGPESSANLSLRAKAVSIVEELQAELRDQPWDVLPSLAISAKRLGRDYVHEGELIESAAELLIELAGAPDGWLWLPFDSSGTMTIRALRKGWKVKAVLMMETLISDLPLLLAIETGKSTHPDIETAVERNPFGHPSTRAQTLIANPPFGMTVRGTRLTQWESPNRTTLDKLTRIETWSVHELIDRVNSKAIFFVSPGLLFTKGQEQRLREYLVRHGGERNELEAVITLPGGVLSSYANIASAILVINKRLETENVRMVDLGVAKRNVAGVEEIVKNGKGLALGLEIDDERVRIVTRQDVINNECIFTPSRYIRQPVDAGPNATALEEFFEVIRPPALEKTGGIDAFEVGIPNLGNWNVIENPSEKIAKIRAKGSHGYELKKGDVILSVKGTLGKCGIVDDIPGAKLVASQSCVALRIRGEISHSGIRPEFLLMYLRSSAGQAQLASLQVGAGMQHISVGTLLSSFRFPMPSKSEHAEVVNAYMELCTSENLIADIQRGMSELAGKFWMA